MNPILIKLGPITIYSYGTMIALSFLTIIHLCTQKAKAEKLNPGIILDLSIIILFSGILGARIAYVITNISYFKNNLLEIIMINKGGLVFFGGFIGALIASFLYLHIKKINPWKIADIIALYLPLGQAIGRIGCLLNGCCFGKSCNLPWGIVFPGTIETLHPTQIYHSLAAIILFFILNTIHCKKKQEGTTFISYLFLYGISRFLIEFFRGDYPTFALNLTGSQLVSLSLITLGSIIIIAKKTKLTIMNQKHDK